MRLVNTSIQFAISIKIDQKRRHALTSAKESSLRYSA